MSRQLHRDAILQKQLDRALSALDANLPQLAMEQLQKVLDQQPHNLTARIALSRAQLAMNQPAAALSELDVAGYYDPDLANGPHAGLLRAAALLGCDRDELARTQLNKLIELCPNDDRAYRMMAELCFKTDDQLGAIEYLNHVRRLVPSDKRIGRILAHLLEKQDPQTGAKMIEGDDSASKLRLTRMFRQVDRDRDAQEIYRRLLEQQTEDAPLWLEAGKLSDDLGANDQAIARLQKAVSINDENKTAALSALAKAYMHAGRFSAAGLHWWQVTAQQPDDVAAWAGCLVCALCCHRPRIAQHAQQNLNRRSGKAQRHQLLTSMWQHAAMGKVIAPFNEPGPVEQQPQQTRLEQLLHSAANTLTRHAEQYPRRADTYYHLSICQDAIGDKSNASQNVQKSLDINPDYRAAQSLARQIELSESRAA
jgi:tetratricopeptide (TPR) repeat protein